jgi:hypothetical protein
MQGSTLFITPYAYVCVCVRRNPTYIHTCICICLSVWFGLCRDYISTCICICTCSQGKPLLLAHIQASQTWELAHAKYNACRQTFPPILLRHEEDEASLMSSQRSI